MRPGALRAARVGVCVCAMTGGPACNALLDLDWTPAGGEGGAGAGSAASSTAASAGSGATLTSTPPECTVDADCGVADVPCYVRTCVSHRCTTGVAPTATPCGAPESVCDGAGNCVACVTDAQCGDGHCEHNSCYSCSDGVKNGAETDVDCGGPECHACADGQTCLVDHDCHKDRSCLDGRCQRGD